MGRDEKYHPQSMYASLREFAQVILTFLRNTVPKNWHKFCDQITDNFRVINPIAQGELPPLFVIGAQGDGQLVNYRFRSPYYIIDRLFGAAELRLGADKGDIVRTRSRDATRPAAPVTRLNRRTLAGAGQRRISRRALCHHLITATAAARK